MRSDHAGWSSAPGLRRAGDIERPSRFEDRGDESLEWMAIWWGCERRLRSWRVPPSWSAREWWEEMRAEAAVAALVAIRDFQPERNVPLGAYIRMRIMGGVLSRYRKEWSYGLRRHFNGQFGGLLEEEPPEPKLSSSLREELDWALGQLGDADRRLVERLFWREETEAEVGRTLGLSQQAISKRKAQVITLLRNKLELSSR